MFLQPFDAGHSLLIGSGQRQISSSLAAQKHLGGLLALLARVWYQFSLFFSHFLLDFLDLALVYFSNTNLDLDLTLVPNLSLIQFFYCS